MSFGVAAIGGLGLAAGDVLTFMPTWLTVAFAGMFLGGLLALAFVLGLAHRADGESRLGSAWAGFRGFWVMLWDMLP